MFYIIKCSDQFAEYIYTIHDAFEEAINAVEKNDSDDVKFNVQDDDHKMDVLYDMVETVDVCQSFPIVEKMRFVFVVHKN